MIFLRIYPINHAFKCSYSMSAVLFDAGFEIFLMENFSTMSYVNGEIHYS